MVQRNGRVYGLNQFSKNVIICANPEIVAPVLTKEFTKFPNRRVGNPFRH